MNTAEQEFLDKREDYPSLQLLIGHKQDFNRGDSRIAIGLLKLWRDITIN